MNSFGQIVTWKLTSGVAFDVVREIILALINRLAVQQKKVSEFYIDNCCAWRKKLQEVFGSGLDVKQDIFHAVKKVGEKVSKKHPLRKMFMDDWRLVFRDPSDLGRERKLTTPAPDVLVANLEKFYQQWHKAEYSGRLIMTESVLKELENIRIKVAFQGLSQDVEPIEMKSYTKI